MNVTKLAVGWLRAYWDEDDITYYLEHDEDGWILRQVELSGPDRTPTVAASLAEWPDADRDGLAAVQAYDAKYGSLGDQPLDIDQPFEFPHAKIDRGEFEDVWVHARNHLERSR